MRGSSSSSRRVRRGALFAASVAIAISGLIATGASTGPSVKVSPAREHAVASTALPHDATVAAPAARVARAHKVTSTDVFLFAAAAGIALAAYGVLHPRRRVATRRGEQFYVRGRGPPLHLATV